MPLKKNIELVTPSERFQNQIVPDNLKNKTIYDGVDFKWQDLPLELFMHILTFVDDRTVIIASGVCTGWKESITSNLQELSLSWCKWNVNNVVLSAVPKFNRLQSLNLHQCKTHLEDQAVEMVAKYCHDLRALDLSSSLLNAHLTDKALKALAHGCNLLEKLNISGCSGFTDSALIFLSEKCNKLRNLSLCGCFRAVTDRALLALAHNCRGLQFLKLGCGERLTDVGVTGLANWCPELRAVSLFTCTWITDKCLLELAYNCRGLQFLNLSLCDKVTDGGVTALAKSCPELRVVDLYGCALITDESVIALAENCHHLRSLSLPYCQKITDTAMYSLVRSNVHRAVKPNVKDKCNNSTYKSESVSKSSISHGSQRRSSGGLSSCHDYMDPVLNDQEDYGLVLLDITLCISVSAPAVQAVCDTFPALHTCPKRCSLIKRCCPNLTSVHCACDVEAPR